MDQTNDIAKLFSRFGASTESYLEFETEFNYKDPPLTLDKPEAPLAPVLVAGPIPASEPLAPEQPSATALSSLLAEVALARQARVAGVEQGPASEEGTLAPAPVCRARIVALVSSRGGVGRTTLCAALASRLNQAGGRTLAIDLDPQNALHHHLKLEAGVTQIGSAGLQEKVWNDGWQQGLAEVRLLPYGVPGEDERCTLERNLRDDRHWLARQLARMALDEQDVVILDTPGGRSVYLEQALDVADQVLVVTTADAASFITLDQMDRALDVANARPAYSHINYVVNQFDANREFSRDMLEVLKRRLGTQLLSVIARDERFGEALAYGHDPLAGVSAAREAIVLLSEQLKARLQLPRATGGHAA